MSGVEDPFAGLCISGSAISVPANIKPVTEEHSTLPEDYKAAAVLTCPGSEATPPTPSKGANSTEASGIVVGDSGLVLPEELLTFNELMDLIQGFNARLRILHQDAEQLHKKPMKDWNPDEFKTEKRIKDEAEENVACVTKLTAEVEKFPDELWTLHERYTAHTVTQDDLEQLECEHQKLFEDLASKSKEAALQAAEKETEMNEKHSALAEAFAESYNALIEALKTYNEAKSNT